ncbi:MAG: poly-gamma-glutamate system protein [Synergistaceae bacterium]|nr:poly-gamma-glutamate system protein [Synergistaceae bacterium]
MFMLLFLTFLFTPAEGVLLEKGEPSLLMARCEEVLYAEKHRLGLADEDLDSLHTGLVGVEFSPLTTSLGHLSDKRAAAQPAMADVVADYLQKAGVKQGDWIALNASGSFPGFTLATLCAAETLGIHVQGVFSYGSSMYGGTDADFTFPVMLDLLNEKGLLSTRFQGVAPGGAWDRMDEVLLEDPWPTVRKLMDSRPEEKIEEKEFVESIRRRHEIFSQAPKPVKCFVSCGGPWTSMGLSEEVLNVPHGLVLSYNDIPSGPDRGLIFDFLDSGVPVIHLIFARGICADYGLPWHHRAD